MVVATPAGATSTMCWFDAKHESVDFGLSFIGYGEISMVQADTREGPRYLLDGSAEVLDFDQGAGTIHVVYRNPGDPSLPPSFVLRSSNEGVAIEIDSAVIIGELHCDVD